MVKHGIIREIMHRGHIMKNSFDENIHLIYPTEIQNPNSNRPWEGSTINTVWMGMSLIPKRGYRSYQVNETKSLKPINSKAPIQTGTHLFHF